MAAGIAGFVDEGIHAGLAVGCIPPAGDVGGDLVGLVKGVRARAGVRVKVRVRVGVGVGVGLGLGLGLGLG